MSCVVMKWDRRPGILSTKTGDGAICNAYQLHVADDIVAWGGEHRLELARFQAHPLFYITP